MPYIKYIAALLIALIIGACDSENNNNSVTDNAYYYIDATAGDDNNNGQSDTSPWKTLNKLSAATLDTPAIIYLKRGEVWNEPLILPANDLTIDAYSSGAPPKIDGAAMVTGWLDIGAGIYSHVVNLTGDQALGNLSENNIMLRFIPWDNDVSTTFITAPTGSYSYDFLLNTLYIKPATSPASNTYSASLQLRGVYAFNLSNISIQNIEVSRVSLNGIEFHNCANCSVENITVSRVGGAVIGGNFIASPDFLYAGNGIDFSNNCNNGSVARVSVTEIFDSCLAVELYLSNSNASAITLADAQLSQCGFAGVEVSVLSNQAINTNSRINGVSLVSINVDSAGKGWSGRRYGIDGHGLRIVADNGAGSMSNITVVNSTMSNSAGDGIKLAGELNAVSLHRVRTNINDGIGINVAAPAATSLRLDLSSSIIDNNGNYGLAYNAPSAAGLNIFHTTFYDNTAINLAVFNQSGIADIRNNLFFSSAAMTHLFSTSTLTNATVNNNCYNDTTNMFGYNGSAYSSVNSFNLATGFGASSIGNGVVGMTDPANGNFNLTLTSSCQALGDASVAVTNDYSNAAFSTPPASGAYEL